MNKTRSFFGTNRTLTFIVEDTECPNPDAFIFMISPVSNSLLFANASIMLIFLISTEYLIGVIMQVIIFDPIINGEKVQQD